MNEFRGLLQGLLTTALLLDPLHEVELRVMYRIHEKFKITSQDFSLDWHRVTGLLLSTFLMSAVLQRYINTIIITVNTHTIISIIIIVIITIIIIIIMIIKTDPARERELSSRREELNGRLSSDTTTKTPGTMETTKMMRENTQKFYPSHSNLITSRAKQLSWSTGIGQWVESFACNITACRDLD